MRKILLPFCFLALASCSMSKKIDKIAKKDMLTLPVFENAHTGIFIFNPENNSKVFDYQSNKYFVPASNTKLMTCYAAMKYLGDSIPGIAYQVLNDSTIYIKGTGDPTFFHPDFPSQRVADFLETYKTIVLEKPDFHEYLGSGWAWNDYDEDYQAPRSQMPLYGNVVKISQTGSGIDATPDYFQSYLKVPDSVSSSDKISVSRPWSENIFIVNKGRSENLDIPFVPSDSTMTSLLSAALHRNVILRNEKVNDFNIVYSRPLDSMLSIMMHRSDNFFAEQSLLMVSDKLAGFMNDRAVIQKLLSTDYAGMPQKPSWVDGSGLSRYDLFSPRDIVFVLKKMKDDFGMERIEKILPTGGTGTLSSLYHNERGKIFAKTGTLNGVVALSGYLITEKNNILIFSILVNNHRGSAGEVRKAIEKFLIKVREMN